MIEQGGNTSALVFDTWRRRIVTARFSGDVGFWSYDGTLEHRFQPYGKTHVRILVVTERWLVMQADRAAGIELWDPVSLERVAAIALPDQRGTDWFCASPDGSTLLTYERVPDFSFAIRIWAIEG